MPHFTSEEQEPHPPKTRTFDYINVILSQHVCVGTRSSFFRDACWPTLKLTVFVRHLLVELLLPLKDGQIQILSLPEAGNCWKEAMLWVRSKSVNTVRSLNSRTRLFGFAWYSDGQAHYVKSCDEIVQLTLNWLLRRAFLQCLSLSEELRNQSESVSIDWKAVVGCLSTKRIEFLIRGAITAEQI